MKKTLLGISLYLFILPLLLTSCKPTEKGYKSAYDAALNKREAVKADVDQNVAVSRLQEVDGAQLKVVDGVEVYVLNQRIRPVEEGKTLPGNYNVAVGTYKMITNCTSQSNDLKNEGYEAFPAREPEGMYYTIAGSFSTLSEAVKFTKEYQKGKDRSYVGLPGAPVIIYSPK